MNNKKIKTVEGTRETWTAEDNKCLKNSLPYLGNGYELRGVQMEGGSFLLHCLNGQPWSDEIIRRSEITLAEIEEIVKKDSLRWCQTKIIISSILFRSSVTAERGIIHVPGNNLVKFFWFHASRTGKGGVTSVSFPIKWRQIYKSNYGKDKVTGR